MLQLHEFVTETQIRFQMLSKDFLDKTGYL